jgi:hypothetical protein
MYNDKVKAFFDQLLNPQNAGKPLMRRYLDSYPDLFWDLHLGAKGEALPDWVRQIGQSFNIVISFRDPRLEIVYENYMKVRELGTRLKERIAERISYRRCPGSRSRSRFSVSSCERSGPIKSNLSGLTSQTQPRSRPGL